MENITPGHLYVLENFEDKTKEGQHLQFIEKIPLPDQPGVLRTVNDGTTNEEVLAVLIDRLNFLQAKFPCRENAIAITHIETALLWLNKRTADRLARGVEGKHLLRWKEPRRHSLAICSVHGRSNRSHQSQWRLQHRSPPPLQPLLHLQQHQRPPHRRWTSRPRFISW